MTYSAEAKRDIDRINSRAQSKARNELKNRHREQYLEFSRVERAKDPGAPWQRIYSRAKTRTVQVHIDEYRRIYAKIRYGVAE